MEIICFTGIKIAVMIFVECVNYVALPLENDSMKTQQAKRRKRNTPAKKISIN